MCIPPHAPSPLPVPPPRAPPHPHSPPSPRPQTKGLEVENLVVTHIQVNKAMRQRRRTYRAHGRVNPYMSSPCHIELIVSEKEAGVKAEQVGWRAGLGGWLGGWAGLGGLGLVGLGWAWSGWGAVCRAGLSWGLAKVWLAGWLGGASWNAGPLPEHTHVH